MAFNRPTMAELNARIASDIETRLPGADARLRRSNLTVMARVLAALAHGVYGFLAYIATQCIPDTAVGEILARWAAIWKITKRQPVAAEGIVRFTGNEAVAIRKGTELQRADGEGFVTVADGVIVGGAASIPVAAAVAGSAGNCAGNTRLTVAAQIQGIAAEAFVGPQGVVNGTDLESDDELRARFLFRLRKPPQGGATHDYEAWAREVPGVTRVWVKPAWMGLGTVGIFFVRDNDPNLIPDPAEVQVVADHLATVRPVTAELYTLAPVAYPVPMTIAVTPDTPTVRDAVVAELADLFRREAEPGGKLILSHLDEAISLAAGEDDHRIDVPAASVVAPPGSIATLGTITWTV